MRKEGGTRVPRRSLLILQESRRVFELAAQTFLLIEDSDAPSHARDIGLLETEYALRQEGQRFTARRMAGRYRAVENRRHEVKQDAKVIRHEGVSFHCMCLCIAAYTYHEETLLLQSSAPLCCV